MSVQTHRFKVGDFECIAINDGDLKADQPGEFFAGASPAELEAAFRQHKIDPANFNIPCICLLIDTGEHRVLVDAGAGPGIQPGMGRLLAGFQAEGITKESITHVILSHGHWDHVGGCTDGHGQPDFPNARYVMARDEWEYWAVDVDIYAYGDDSVDVIRFVQEKLVAIEKNLDQIEPTVEIVPGIQVVATPGHTLHHTSVIAKSGEATLVCPVDVIDHPIHIENPDWHPAWDKDAEKGTESRRQLIQQAVDTGAIVHGFHFPFPGVGHIVEAGNGWRFESLDIAD